MGKIEMILKAKEDFISKKIDMIIGWKKEDDSIESIPAFIDEEAELDTLIFDEYCVNNLAKYLIEETHGGKKVGVFLKKCDRKGFDQIIIDNRLSKENVIVYEIICDGMKDFVTGEIFKKCETCLDENLDKYAEVKEIENMSYDERYEYWMGELSKCIRCNACRNICPACNCETCVFENKDEDVLGKANNESETGFYQIIRAYHVAGRCSDCGECERICPVGIPLGKINRKIIKDLEELYGAEEDSLSNFDIEDKDSFSDKKGGK
ncbi:MAG: 4Fe-4S dicluster domain-containing protein [Cetobacterium sp.]|uniref:4Fe-4S dicluster domain-containing protein n=1 Tax=Cetobacterium sp. TaxID=2071632 RepID=UPI0025EDCDA2|nr:4Fe-4S dicluster domain-containing protein [uncultured Cetobacterium sp.]